MNYYCERIDLSFWSEPVNALTNLGFILAGLFAFYLMSKTSNQTTHPVHLKLLASFMIIIGVGSFLFHTLANYWSMMADIIPIYIFQIIFLWSYLRYALKFTPFQTIIGFVIFIASVVATKVIPFDINGSEMYLPSIIILVVFSILAKIRNAKLDLALLLASLCFCISLTMRTIDQNICEQFPLGTHFGWHVFNSAVLFLLWLSLYQMHKNNRQMLN